MVPKIISLGVCGTTGNPITQIITPIVMVTYIGSKAGKQTQFL